MNLAPLKSAGWTSLRVALGCGLLALLLAEIPPGTLGKILELALTRRHWLVAGVLLALAGLCAGAWRWHLILLAQGFRSAPVEVFRLFFIGQFFNAFMLGACGGDVARAYLVTRGSEDKKTEAATTVFLDRAVGLLVLMALGGLMVLIRFPLFLQRTATLWPALLLLILLAGFSSALFVLFHRNRFERWALFQRLEKNTRLGPWIRRAYDSIYFFRSHHRAVGWAVVFSLVNTLLLTLSCAAFGRALYLPVANTDYLTLFPLITVLAAIPLTPGSLGVREGLFVTLFGALGIDSPSAFLLSLLVYASGTVWSVFGGLLFLAGPEKKTREKGA